MHVLNTFAAACSLQPAGKSNAGMFCTAHTGSVSVKRNAIPVRHVEPPEQQTIPVAFTCLASFILSSATSGDGTQLRTSPGPGHGSSLGPRTSARSCSVLQVTVHNTNSNTLPPASLANAARAHRFSTLGT